MTPANDTIVVQFSYNARPECPFALLRDSQISDASYDVLTYATIVPEDEHGDIAAQHQNGTLIWLAQADAAYRPKIRPVRHLGASSDRMQRKHRACVATTGHPVRPAHPTHLVIVSARRQRPARLVASQPVAAADQATRAALYPAIPTVRAPQNGLRLAAHGVAIVGLFMSLTDSAVAQQMLAMF
jgi:hypothetical protein